VYWRVGHEATIGLVGGRWVAENPKSAAHLILVTA